MSLTVIDDDGESSSVESLQTVRESTATVSAGGNVPVEGGKANFSADNGRVVWHDQARKLKVQSTRITSVTRDGSTATITGECKLNKHETATFILQLTDGAPDPVRMQVGQYVASGTVSGGNVVVR